MEKRSVEEIVEFYKNSEPGKYWQLPKNKKNMKDQMLLNENYYSAVKNDGEWGRLIVGVDRKVLIQGRVISKKTGTYTDQTEKLPHIAKAAAMIYEPGTVLLGEVCFDNPKKTSKDVGSIMRCLVPKALERQEDEKLVFKVFDVLSMNGIETYSFKAENRKSIVENMVVGGGIMATEFSDDARGLLKKVFERGGEGIMLMKRDEPYKFGNKKAWHSLKIKKELDEKEAKVLELSVPNMIYAGTELKSWSYWQLTFEGGEIAHVQIQLHDYLVKGKEIIVEGKLVKQALPLNRFYFKKWPAGIVIKHNGKIVTITSGLSDQEREYLAGQGKKDIESGILTAVYGGMEETEDGSIRHPFVTRLRTDA